MSMTLVSTLTVGSGGASSISFTGIPQDGTDLLVLLSGRSDSFNFSVDFFWSINNLTSGYSDRSLYAINTSVFSAANYAGNYFPGAFTWVSPAALPGSRVETGTFGNSRIYFPNYTSSLNKTASLESVTGNNGMVLSSVLNTTTSAISSMTLKPISGNFIQNSTASLYKITKA